MNIKEPKTRSAIITLPDWTWKNKYKEMLNNNSTSFPNLVTERLTLRQLEVTDEQEIFTLRSDSEINKYLGRKPANTMEDARNFINGILEHSKTNDSFYWAITLTGNQKLVGTICLYGFSEENNNCEIGYELLTDYQGQGIMTEALEKVVDYAFNTIGVQKIEAYFHKDNQRSTQLLENLSFKNSYQQDDKTPELLCYYLTNENIANSYAQ